MPAKKIVTSKKVVAKPEVKSGGLTVPVYSLVGKTSTTLALPKEIFGNKVNKKLLAQALRVYMTNQKSLLGSTKTRGEVEGSTVKIFRQKGTGRARHGSVRAPIFVGGGIVFGPQSRKVRLDMPQKMKKAALISALSEKALESNVLGLTGIEKASGKTKEMVGLLKKISDSDKKMKKTLVVTETKNDNAVRAVRNIANMDVITVDGINVLEVLKHEILLITKGSIDKLNSPKEKVSK